MGNEMQNHVTDLNTGIPAMTADLVFVIGEHVIEAENYPAPGIEGRWHKGQEIFIRLDPDSIARIRDDGAGLGVPYLYPVQLETDDDGDLVLTVRIPD